MTGSIAGGAKKTARERVRLAGDSSTRPLRGLGRNDGKALLRLNLTESDEWKKRGFDSPNRFTASIEAPMKVFF
jgi:hypothetical protein